MLNPVSTHPFRSSWSSNLSLKLSLSLEMQEEDIHTVTTLTSPKGQDITLIGTAHLSQRSNDQVQRLIQEIQPNVVLVELDPSRLIRIGITSLDELTDRDKVIRALEGVIEDTKDDLQEIGESAEQ